MKSFSGFMKGALLGTFMLGTALSASAQSPRKILIEEFTNASCGPCAAQNPTFHAFLTKPDVQANVIPMTIHPNFPGPNDPMYLADKVMNMGRFNYYGSSKITGVPTAITNGNPHTPLGGSYIGAPGDTASLRAKINAELAKNNGMSPLTISLTYTKEASGNHKVKVDVSSVSAITNNKKIKIAILQNHAYYANAGNNGEKDFEWVLRKMLPDYKGSDFSINQGETKTFEQSFKPAADWDASQLYAVVFVQDDFTQEVLQAGTNYIGQVSVDVAAESNIYSIITRGGSQTKEVTVSNPTDQEITVKLAVDTETSILPDGWSGEVTPATVTIPANGSTTATLSVTAPAGSGGYAQVVVEAIPEINQSGMFGKSSTVIAAGFLAENTKYGVLNLAGYSGTYYSTLSNSQYANELAILPYDPAALAAFSSQMFEVTIVSLNDAVLNSYRGVPLEISGQNFNLIPMIQASLEAGKDVAVFANSGLYYAYDVNAPAITQTTDVKNFFSTIGIEYAGSKARANLSTGALSPFTVTGVAGDIIGGEMGTTQLSNTNPGYNVYTDIIKIKSGSSAKSIMYYDNTTSQIAGVRYEAPSKGKLVYMTMGIEASGDANQGFRDQLMGKIMEYFEGQAPNVSMDFNTTMLDFEKVNLLTEKELTLTISSTGNQDLVISAMNITGAQAMSFDVMNVSLPITIPAGEEMSFTVKFVPTVAGDNNAILNIVSNTGSDAGIVLYGEGVTGSSVDPYTPAALEVLAVEVGPNPVVDHALLQYTVGGMKTQNIEFSLVDALGVQVLNLGTKTSEPGAHTFEFSTATIPAGSYRLVARSAETSVQIPVVIVR